MQTNLPVVVSHPPAGLHPPSVAPYSPAPLHPCLLTATPSRRLNRQNLENCRLSAIIGLLGLWLMSCLLDTAAIVPAGTAIPSCEARSDASASPKPLQPEYKQNKINIFSNIDKS